MKKTWEEEFDEQFNITTDKTFTYEDIKRFIRSLLNCRHRSQEYIAKGNYGICDRCGKKIKIYFQSPPNLDPNIRV